MTTLAKARAQKIAEQDAAVKRLLAETGYTGSADPYDPQRQLVERRLLGEMPWMYDSDRRAILDKGESPFGIRPRGGRHGWAVKIKGDAILIERYRTGTRDDAMTMTIPLAAWPTTTRAWRPNLAYAQRAVLWRVVTAMFKRVYLDADLTKSEVIIQATQDCDAICGKIRDLVADEWPGLSPADQTCANRKKRSKGKAPKPPKPKVIATPGEAERIEPPQVKFGATMDDLWPDYLTAPPPEPPPQSPQEPIGDEDTLVVLRKSALRGLVAEFDALKAEVETLRKQQQEGMQP